jgi:phosphate transport system substrate-binding protein
MRLLKLLNFLSLAIAFFSFSATSTNLLAQTKVVRIDGSSTVYPITKLAGEAFEQETKGDVKVNVAFSGTTGGFASSSKEKSTSPMRPAQF